MKKLILLFLVLLFSISNCQGLEIQYKFEVKNTLFNELYEFPAILFLDNKNQQLYTVQYGISEQAKDNTGDSGDFSLIEKGSYSYILYHNNKNIYFIGDKINGKNFIFKDDFSPIKYELKDESKIINNIKLKKAEAEFRGRNYIIWYDPSAEIKGGPWKFTNLPGIAYEIYDNENLFRWTLQKIEKIKSNIKNPFTFKEIQQEALPYTEYPKLKYTSQVYKKDASQNKGNFSKFEQNRDGLEKTFEWEK